MEDHGWGGLFCAAESSEEAGEELHQKPGGVGKEGLDGLPEALSIAGEARQIGGEGDLSEGAVPDGDGGDGSAAGGDLPGNGPAPQGIAEADRAAAQSQSQAQGETSCRQKSARRQPSQGQEPQTHAPQAHRTHSDGAQGHHAGGHVSDGQNTLGLADPPPGKLDVDQGEAEEGGAAPVFKEEGVEIGLRGGARFPLGRGPWGGGLLAQNQVVQADREALGQGGEVVQVGPGGAGIT